MGPMEAIHCVQGIVTLVLIMEWSPARNYLHFKLHFSPINDNISSVSPDLTVLPSDRVYFKNVCIKASVMKWQEPGEDYIMRSFITYYWDYKIM
jgi:hypothetical protein